MKYGRTRELYLRYAGTLEPWQIKLALARLRRFRLPLDAWEDAMQELAIVIHAFRFDPAKAHAASEQTILCTALDNRLRTLARSSARSAACVQRIGEMTCSEVAPETQEAQTIGDDVRQVVASLTPSQREICEALMQGMAIHQIARQQGVAWCTVARQVAAIRQSFIEEGFDSCGL